jgi:hypothetical protein
MMARTAMAATTRIQFAVSHPTTPEVSVADPDVAEPGVPDPEPPELKPWAEDP